MRNLAHEFPTPEHAADYLLNQNVSFVTIDGKEISTNEEIVKLIFNQGENICTINGFDTEQFYWED